MTELERQVAAYETFWHFLSYLKKYVTMVKDITYADTDPGRTRLLSTLIEQLYPVLRADLAFVGYRDLEDDMGEWLEIVRESVRPEGVLHAGISLIVRLEELDWHCPFAEFEVVQLDSPAMLFDQGLEKLPMCLRGAVMALAASRMVLLGREYFLFFCDVEEYTDTTPRYDDFDKAMLAVATGLVEAGFRSGVRGGRQVQQDIEEAQTRQFLLDLVHEIKIPIQAVIADASNLLAELPADYPELHEMAARNLRAARHLSLLVDNVRMTEHRLPDDQLLMRNLEDPLREALDVLAGEAEAKGLKTHEPRTADGQPFPRLPLHFHQMTIAFKNLIHNAIVYSVPENGEYIPIEIVGYRMGEGQYRIDITNHGIEISPDEIEQRLLFKLRYRGEKARQIVASGSGLGLTSAERIVNRHGGEILVASVPARQRLFQNTFSVVLPIVDPEKGGSDT